MSCIRGQDSPLTAATIVSYKAERSASACFASAKKTDTVSGTPIFCKEKGESESKSRRAKARTAVAGLVGNQHLLLWETCEKKVGSVRDRFRKHLSTLAL